MDNIKRLKEYIKYEKVLDKYELLRYIDDIESEVNQAIDDASDVSDMKWEIEGLKDEIYELEKENEKLEDEIEEYKSVLGRK